jgi:cobalt-zinc-cadmium efflux system outer membrane protein
LNARLAALIVKALSISLLTAVLLQAQTPLNISTAIEEAVSAHPDVAAAEARIAAARGARIQAALAPNPRLILQSENTRLWGTPPLSYWRDTDNFLYLQQVFERPDKRRDRVSAADAAVLRAEAERDLARRSIAVRVSSAYWLAYAAQTVARLLADEARNFDQIVQYHRDRVREGAMAEVDLLRILLERDRITVNIRSAEQDAVRLKLEVQRSMGRRQFADITLTELPLSLEEISEPTAEKAIQSRAEVVVSRRVIEAARARLQSQESNAEQDPEGLFGYKRTGGYNTLLAGLQINLPLRNRNQGQIATAVAEIRQAEQEAQGIESQIRAEVAIAWSEVTAKRKLLTDVLQPMRDRAVELSRIAQAAYREGGTDLLRLIDAERSRLEAISAYTRALAEYQLALTQLQIAIGGPL